MGLPLGHILGRDVGAVGKVSDASSKWPDDLDVLTPTPDVAAGSPRERGGRRANAGQDRDPPEPTIAEARAGPRTGDDTGARTAPDRAGAIVGAVNPAVLTVAVKVANWPDTDGLIDEASAVVVGASFKKRATAKSRPVADPYRDAFPPSRSCRRAEGRSASRGDCPPGCESDPTGSQRTRSRLPSAPLDASEQDLTGPFPSTTTFPSDCNAGDRVLP